MALTMVVLQMPRWQRPNDGRMAGDDCLVELMLREGAAEEACGGGGGG